MKLELCKLEQPFSKQLASIAANIMPFPWTEQIFLTCFGGDYINLGLFIKKQLIGFIITKKESDGCCILNIGIDKPYQRQKLGRLLLEAVLEQPFPSFWLEVRISNLAAICLYKQLGFKEIARRPGYYPGVEKREEAVVMCYQKEKP